MRLSFSPEHQELSDEFHRVLSAESSSERARSAAESAVGWDRPLWRQLAELGWFGIAIDEALGGMGQTPEVLCLMAERFGGTLAAIPFANSILGFAEAIREIGQPSLSEGLLPQVATGAIVGSIVMPGTWEGLEIAGGAACGRAVAVPEGAAATHLLTRCGEGCSSQLLVIDVTNAQRHPVDSLDRINPVCAIALERAPVHAIAEGEAADTTWRRILARYAIFLSFTQIGAADLALRTACDHVTQRYAFGRPLGSFQAIKHGLADVYAAIEVARCNAWYAAATLGEPENALIEAGAAARVSATLAHRQAARANIHYLGGLGVTAESDAHLHYRRAQALGQIIGSPSVWREEFLRAVLRRRARAVAA